MEENHMSWFKRKPHLKPLPKPPPPYHSSPAADQALAKAKQCAPSPPPPQLNNSLKDQLI